MRVTPWCVLLGGRSVLPCAPQNLNVAVAGVPKTIDNDVDIIDRSFGFLTSVEVRMLASWAFDRLASVKRTRKGVPWQNCFMSVCESGAGGIQEILCGCRGLLFGDAALVARPVCPLASASEVEGLGRLLVFPSHCHSPLPRESTLRFPG